MLLQTLNSQGCVVEWYERLPEPIPADAKPNNRAAAWIKKVARRPGRRLKSVGERLAELNAKDNVAPPPEAAIRRKVLTFSLFAVLTHM